MKNLTFYPIFCLIIFIFASPASAKFFKYTELRIKDYDHMKSYVGIKIKEAKSISQTKQEEGDDESGDREAIEILRETLKYVMSRPDTDNMISKLLPDLRRELTNFNSYEDTLSSLVSESMTSVKSKKLPKEYRATYLFVLENIMSEMQRYLGTENTNHGDYKKVFKKIMNSKMKVPKVVRSERHMVGMFASESPSKVAEKILKKHYPKDFD